MPDSRGRRGLRLRLRRRPDPVLSFDELEFIAERMRHYIAWADREMAAKLVSESVIRGRMYATDSLAKITEVLDS